MVIGGTVWGISKLSDDGDSKEKSKKRDRDVAATETVSKDKILLQECGHSVENKNWAIIHHMKLQPGTLLQNGKYRIEGVLGQGGFGITYLAEHTSLNGKVCIKEFFFKEYCEREGDSGHISLGTQSSHEIVERFMAKFLKEARTISRFEHSNIIRIHDIFMENNTAYYVMEYIDGESLADKINNNGGI